MFWKSTSTHALLLAMLLFACSWNSLSQTSTQAAEDLADTTWQLVKFQGGDDKPLAPEDKWKYTITFSRDGSVNVRIDCNRGRGSWKSPGPQQIQFGPLALTDGMCPASDLTAHMAKDWQNVRSYTIKDGHLFLSLMADAGTYEFESPSSVGPGDTVTMNEGMPVEASGRSARFAR